MTTTELNQVPPNGHVKTPWIVLALPLVMVVVILFASPNFRNVDGVRNAPLGGDFLQEWIGAKTFAMGLEDRLYDLDYVKAMQHDAALVGFDWDEEKYFPMVYPPFYYQLLQPFSTLNYSIASKIWLLFSALAFSLTGYLLYRNYPPCRQWFAVCFVAAMIFVPLLNCFNMGQKSTVLLLILAGTYLLLYHKRPFLAGLVFGLIVFKPHLGIVIGLGMLWKRQWRFVLGAIVMVLAAIGFSWLNNDQLCRDYLNAVLGMTDYVQTGGYQLADSHSLWGAAQLTLSGLSSETIKVATVALSLVVAGLLVWLLNQNAELDSALFARQFAAMVLATAILSPHFYSYDLTILLLPMLLILSSFPTGEWKENASDLTLSILLACLFLFAGLFSQVAEVIRIQPSVLLMIGAVLLIGLSNRKHKFKLRDVG